MLEAQADIEMPLSPWSRSPLKRIVDIAVVCAASPLLCPLFLIIAAAVRLSSHGPAIFRQTRIGACAKPFTILKFRTMLVPDADEQHGIASAAAERITPIGEILRKLKLDELPQFFNVLRGDMSLVGPRSQNRGTTAPASSSASRESPESQRSRSHAKKRSSRRYPRNPSPSTTATTFCRPSMHWTRPTWRQATCPLTCAFFCSQLSVDGKRPNLHAHDARDSRPPTGRRAHLRQRTRTTPPGHGVIPTVRALNLN